tara:strand:- start:2630 stop:2956 length:327 start_codon:yes stop_codon:yes gene_type:complete
MPHSKSAIKIEAPTTENEVLSAFAKEQSNANQAPTLDGRQFNAYVRLNDLRAIQQVDASIFDFFCRYANDPSQTEAKIQAFAKDHAIACKLFEIESVRQLMYEESHDV